MVVVVAALFLFSVVDLFLLVFVVLLLFLLFVLVLVLVLLLVPLLLLLPLLDSGTGNYRICSRRPHLVGRVLRLVYSMSYFMVYLCRN